MSLNELIAVMNYHPRTQARVVISLQADGIIFARVKVFAVKPPFFCLLRIVRTAS